MFSARCPIYHDKQLLIIHKINENLAKIKTITDKRKCTRSHICAPIIKKTKNLLAILCFPETTKEMNKKHNSAKTNNKSPQKRFFLSAGKSGIPLEDTREILMISKELIKIWFGYV